MGYIGNQPGSPTSQGDLPSFVITAPTYNVGISDAGHMLLADASGGVLTVNLPSVTAVPLGFRINVKKTDSSANAVNLVANGAEMLNVSFASIAIATQHDGIDITAGNAGWFSDSSSGAGAGAGAGGGGLSTAGGSDSMPHGEFDIGINKSSSLILTTTSITNSYQYTGSGAAIVHGVIASNINGTAEVLVDMAVTQFTDGSTYYQAKAIPIPAGTSIDLLKKAKVLKHNDRLKFKTDTSSGVNLSIRYSEFSANTDLFKVFFNAGVGAVGGQVIYTESNVTGSVVESILLANIDGTNNVKVSVSINDGSANPMLVSTMNIPAGSTVEVCEIPVVLNNTDTITVNVTDADRLNVTIAGRIS